MKDFNRLLRLNLQNFSNPDDENPKDDPEDKEKDKKTEEVEFTEEQKEYINKLVGTAKSKAKSEYEKSLDEKVKELLKKEKDYEKMSEKEREIKEFEDKQKQFEEERENFEYDKLLVSVREDLVKKNLPSEFAEYLAVKGDNEKSLTNVGVFESKYNEAVAQAVKEKLKQSPPSDGHSGTGGTSLGAQLAKHAAPKGKIFD